MNYQLPNTFRVDLLYGALEKNPNALKKMRDAHGSDRYRPYFFPSDNSLSGMGLTPLGLTEYLLYLYRQDPETHKNTLACINWDPNCTPDFDPKFFEKMIGRMNSESKRASFLIYRGNHTVSVMKEDDTLLLLDSYNAFGAKDSDHIPLLANLRKNFPESKIFTLNDKIQNDYHNCAFFAANSTGAIEKYLQHEGVSLAEFIQTLDTNKIHTPQRDNPGDCFKVQKYVEHGVRTIPVPPQLVSFVQSLTLAEKIADGSEEFVRGRPWHPYGSYAQELENFSAHERPRNCDKLKKMNIHMSVKNEMFDYASQDCQTPATEIRGENRNAAISI